MSSNPKIYIAIPVMDELDTLPYCLECIEKQSYPNIHTVICVNQPEHFQNSNEKKHIFLNNQKTLNFLKNYHKPPLTIIDKSSKGKGWTGKKHGVGWARKIIMDYIASIAQPTDIIISMDADTLFNPLFCETIVNNFSKHRKAVAMAMPYFHKLTGDSVLDRAMLRYEIYMRYYVINLWRIHNPYCFTAIGSSLAVPVFAYKSVKGISPKLSGEDFYFLQKLRKHGNIIVWNEEFTYPATRYSDRVFFGTGPALIKGAQNNWESYPLYSYKLFDEVKETYDAFETLYTKDIPTPMTGFLENIFPEKNIWQPLRENYPTKEKFLKACATKVDGLRILQYLKSKQQLTSNDAIFLKEYLYLFHPEKTKNYASILEKLHFDHTPIEELDKIRILLADIENTYRMHYKIINWYW